MSDFSGLAYLQAQDRLVETLQPAEYLRSHVADFGGDSVRAKYEGVKGRYGSLVANFVNFKRHQDIKKLGVSRTETTTRKMEAQGRLIGEMVESLLSEASVSMKHFFSHGSFGEETPSFFINPREQEQLLERVDAVLTRSLESLNRAEQAKTNRFWKALTTAVSFGQIFASSWFKYQALEEVKYYINPRTVIILDDDRERTLERRVETALGDLAHQIENEIQTIPSERMKQLQLSYALRYDFRQFLEVAFEKAIHEQNNFRATSTATRG